MRKNPSIMILQHRHLAVTPSRRRRMITNKVRMKVPVELQRRAAKLLNSSKYKKEVELKSQPLLIRCPFHPHRLNQVYPPGSEIPLSSSTWGGRKSIGRSFTFLPVSSGKPRSSEDFSALGLTPSLNSLLKAHNFSRPTNIQALAIPQILEADSDILIASETGNGKTLSFLLPILHGLLREKAVDSPYNTPRAVIAAPSRELALQIHKVVETLSGGLGLRSICTLGGSTKTMASWGPRDNYDILVSTLGALNKHFSNGYMHKNEVRFLVFDEADSLLDDTFARVSANIISSVQRTRKGACQIIFSGATMPKHIKGALGSVLDVDGIKTISTNSLHRVPVNIKQKFVRTSMTGKFPILLQEIEKDVLKKKKVLIFVNKGSTSIWLEHALRDENIGALAFSQHISYKYRHRQIERFLSSSPENEEGVNILIASDLGSRGLDFDASLHHVVNYDFPPNMSDYIHRIGRVGRVGSEGILGRVSNLVNSPLDVELLQKIEGAVRRNTLLPNVNSNIFRIIQRRREAALEDKLSLEASQDELLRKIGVEETS